MMVNPYGQYRQNQVATAAPEKLLLMLYDGAVKFVKSAREGVARRDMERANREIKRVQDILVELSSALDFSRGEVSDNLFSLYEYMNRGLIEANMKKDDRILGEVEVLLGGLRDTWRQVLGVVARAG
jgi:flagellar protein FliS